MADLHEKLIESTIDSLYLAVTDENRWPEALAGLGRAFDSPRVGILRTTPRMDGLYEMRSLNHDARSQRLYNEYYWALDPSHPITREAAVGEWLDRPEIFDPQTTPEPEYMNDYAIPNGIRWVVGGKVHVDATSATILGLQRPADHRPFDNAAAGVFRRLSTHVGRACKLSADLRQAELAKGLSLAAIDGIEWPVYAVNSGARLLLANRAGERQLVLGSPFRMHAGRIVCTEPNAATALHQAMKQVGRSRASAFRVAQRTGTWLVRVLPVSGYVGTALIYAAPAERAPVPSEILRNMLHFTAAEAEIAYMLTEGSTAKEIAFARGVSINTVRAQVRDILRKAGVRRLTDLAKILAGIPQVTHVGEDGDGRP